MTGALPAGIRQRGSSYLISVSVKGVRRTATTPLDLNKAQRIQADLRAALFKEVGADNPAHQDTWTLKQALDKTAVIAWTDKESGAKLTRNGEMVVEILGPATPLTSITTETIDTLVTALQALGNSNGTVNRKLAALSRMLTIAHQRGKLDRMPHIQRRVEAECRIRFLSQEEEATALHILRQWGKEDHADAVVVLIDTAMRPSELWRMEARDADHQVINIWKTKSHNPRSIPMTERVKAILRRRILRFPRGPLFPYANDWMEQVWDRMKAQMGLGTDTQFLVYALRHTCISRLVQRGVPLKVVQEWSGHQIITTTMRYAHLCPSSLLNAVHVLNAPQQGHTHAIYTTANHAPAVRRRASTPSTQDADHAPRRPTGPAVLTVPHHDVPQQNLHADMASGGSCGVAESRGDVVDTRSLSV